MLEPEEFESKPKAQDVCQAARSVHLRGRRSGYCTSFKKAIEDDRDIAPAGHASVRMGRRCTEGRHAISFYSSLTSESHHLTMCIQGDEQPALIKP